MFRAQNKSSDLTHSEFLDESDTKFKEISTIYLCTAVVPSSLSIYTE